MNRALVIALPFQAAVEDIVLVGSNDQIADRQPAFSDPFAGWRLAHGQLDAGADVIFAAAGASGLGAHVAAGERGAFAIGVDDNQNYLHPGVMLTSAIKRIDRAVALSISRAADGEWRGGQLRLGLADGGVDYVIARHNIGLIDASTKAAVEEARAGIIDGAIAIAPIETD